jgi:hypothetical protein
MSHSEQPAEKSGSAKKPKLDKSAPANKNDKKEKPVVDDSAKYPNGIVYCHQCGRKCDSKGALRVFHSSVDIVLTNVQRFCFVRVKSFERVGGAASSSVTSVSRTDTAKMRRRSAVGISPTTTGLNTSRNQHKPIYSSA